MFEVFTGKIILSLEPEKKNYHFFALGHLYPQVIPDGKRFAT